MGRPVGQLGVLQEGDYKLRLEDVQAKISQKGTLYVWSTLMVLEGEMTGRTCRITNFLGNQTGEQLFQELLLALGATKETILDDEDEQALTKCLQQFKGKVVYARINVYTDERGSSNQIPFGGVKAGAGGGFGPPRSGSVPF